MCIMFVVILTTT